MNVASLFRKQLASYGFPVPFDVQPHRVLPDEISHGQFFCPNGRALDIKTKPCLESAVKTYQYVYMVSKLFGKETLYKVGEHSGGNGKIQTC